MRITGGDWGGLTIRSPAGDKTRPTSDATREALFNILGHGLAHPLKHVVDLFAGSGSLSIEALSRGAESVRLIESDAKARACIEKNLNQVLKTPRDWAIIAEADASRWPALLRRSYPAPAPLIDTVFCDPPYRKDLVARAFRAFSRAPEIFAPEALWIAELADDEKVPKAEGWEILQERERGSTRLVFYRLRTQNRA